MEREEYEQEIPIHGRFITDGVKYDLSETREGLPWGRVDEFRLQYPSAYGNRETLRDKLLEFIDMVEGYGIEPVINGRLHLPLITKDTNYWYDRCDFKPVGDGDFVVEVDRDYVEFYQINYSLGVPLKKWTLDEIEFHKSERGGYTKSALACMGVDYPGVKGWDFRLVMGENPNLQPLIAEFKRLPDGSWGVDVPRRQREVSPGLVVTAVRFNGEEEQVRVTQVVRRGTNYASCRFERVRADSWGEAAAAD
jgi:hypothetical protein